MKWLSVIIANLIRNATCMGLDLDDYLALFVGNPLSLIGGVEICGSESGGENMEI